MNINLTSGGQACEFPMLALRGLTVFPGMNMNFDVERLFSINALNASMDGDRKIFLLTQKDITIDIPGRDDLYTVGTVCAVRQLLRIPNGGVKVLVEGICRARLLNFSLDRSYYYASVEIVGEDDFTLSSPKSEALVRRAFSLFSDYSSLTGTVAKETVLAVFSEKNPGFLSDYIAQNTAIRVEDKQIVLETIDSLDRAELICNIMSDEVEIAKVEKEIDKKLMVQLGEQQRTNILREQYNIIRSELGMDAYDDQEFDTYREKISELKLESEIEDKLLKEVSRLEHQPFGSAEATVIRNYLDACLELPWNVFTASDIDIDRAAELLDRDHFGLKQVKERIIEYLAVRQYAPENKGTILCLVGPPGTGKTSIAVSIAEALDRKLARVALGGVHDEAEIRGHRKTYVGAMPGRIMGAISQCKAADPVMLLDEIDKLGHDYRGDPSSALLEVLDPEQNCHFRDNFLEIPFDLSNAMFITTANDISTIPRPLLDRMEVIELSSYTDLEKLEIAKRHLIPKQRRKHNLNGNQLRFTDEAITQIITGYTKESGVRNLEREIAKICRKTVINLLPGESKRVTVKKNNLSVFLGACKFCEENNNKKNEIGIVNGLAWTSAGGEILEVEVNVFPGTGRIELTGNLGEVMKESAKIAVSCIRGKSLEWNVDPDFYKNTDIHIHFPEGAIPKDGPSAGITMTVAILSALTNIPVRRDIAMTGEITLRGRVLPIGGLREKSMAALREKIFTVIIPRGNMKDLEEIDPLVKDKLTFIPAENVEDIIDFVMPQRTSEEKKQPQKPQWSGEITRQTAVLQ